MIFIQVDENDIVTMTHNMPFDENYGLGKTKEELDEMGFFVDLIPPLESIAGKTGYYRFDHTSNTVQVEYIDRELTQEELFQQANQKVSVLEKTVADLEFQLMMGGIL